MCLNVFVFVFTLDPVSESVQFLLVQDYEYIELKLKIQLQYIFNVNIKEKHEWMNTGDNS